VLAPRARLAALVATGFTNSHSLQLVVQDDAVDVRFARVQALGDAKVGAVALRVVFELARTLEAGVELLAGISVAVAVVLPEVRPRSVSTTATS
jgi:hypothetical protein